MYQKLEDRLKLYEHDHPIKDDDGLIAAIESILNEQDSLPIEERDFDLIAEATDSILKLQGYRVSDRATMAEEAANSVKARIALQKGITSNGKPQNKHRSVLRWIIPLVAVLAITTVAVFASPNNRLAISDITHRIYASLIPKTVYHDDNIDLVITDETATYASLNELSEVFGNILLLPFDIEEDLVDLSIEVLDLGDSYEISISFNYINSPCTIIITHLPNNSESTIKYNNTVGGRDVAVKDCDNYILTEWVYNQNHYQVKTNNMDSEEFIISILRAKNE